MRCWLFCAVPTFLQIPSDQGISFDKAPAMKAREIAAATRKALLSGEYDVVRCNFPNPGGRGWRGQTHSDGGQEGAWHGMV